MLSTTVGLARTIYGVYGVYGVFGREITNIRSYTYGSGQPNIPVLHREGINRGSVGIRSGDQWELGVGVSGNQEWESGVGIGGNQEWESGVGIRSGNQEWESVGIRRGRKDY